MKTITITCVNPECGQPYTYEYKGGRKRRTCDRPECQTKRANFTRARSRAKASGKVQEYYDNVRPVGLTVEEQTIRAEEHAKWKAYFQDRPRPNRESSDVDMDGWEEIAETDEDGNRLFEDQESLEAPSADSWVPMKHTGSKYAMPSDTVYDDFRADFSAVKELPPAKREAVEAWYASVGNDDPTVIPPPVTAVGVGSTSGDYNYRNLPLLGSAIKPEPSKGMSANTWRRHYNPVHAIQGNARPLGALKAFAWDTSVSALPEPPMREHEWGVSYVLKQGKTRGLMAPVDTGALEDGRDWSRWTTTDTSSWWD